MIVYPANNSHAHTLELVFPGSLGILFSPSGKRKPKNLPYALDNEMFSAWAKSGFAKSMEQQRLHWDSSAFLYALVWCGKQEGDCPTKTSIQHYREGSGESV